MDPQVQEIIDRLTSILSVMTGLGSSLTKLTLTANASANKGGGSTSPRASLASQSTSGLKDVVERILGSFTAKLAIVLGPLTAFATILGSANSGFGVFLKTVNVLAASLAPLLLPAFVLLGAAVLTVSDYIWSKLQPALGEFYKWIFENAIPALSALVEAFNEASRRIEKIIENPEEEYPKAVDDILLGGLLQGIGLIGRQQQQQGASGQPPPPGVMGGIGGMQVDPIFQGDPEKGEKGPGGVLGKFLGNLRLIGQELKLSTAPPVQQLGLVQASRSAQLAASGQSPLEAKIQGMIQDSINQLIAAIEEVGMKVNIGAGL